MVLMLWFLLEMWLGATAVFTAWFLVLGVLLHLTFRKDGA